MKKTAWKHSSMFIIITIAAVLCGSILYARILYMFYQEKALDTLTEVSSQSALLLQKEVEKEKRIISNLGTVLGQMEASELTASIDKLAAISQESNFKRMGIILPNGMAHTTDGLTLDLRDRSYFSSSMNHLAAVSDTLIDKADGERIHVYSAPIERDDQVLGVLFATYATNRYAALLSSSTFNGTGYSYVVQSDGTCITGTSHPSGLEFFDNCFSTLVDLSPGNATSAKQLQANLLQNNSGTVIITDGSQRQKYLYYQPLGINDWYLLSIIPMEIVQQESRSVLLLAYFYAAVCVAAFILLLLQINKIRMVSRASLERIAYVDEITGGSTYTKFKEDALKLLQKSSPASYALVCLNIEKFKFVNNSFGYEEGNRALQFISETIKEQLRPDETYARQTADRYVMLLHYHQVDVLNERVEKIASSISNKQIFQEKYYKLKPVLGIYGISDATEVNIDYMLDCATIARKSISDSILVSFAWYDDVLKNEMMRYRELENRFSDALAEEEFVIYFQPQYNLKTNSYGSSEALVRWETPNGLLSPITFIPVFERNGSVILLDQYVFEKVCSYIRAWLDLGYTVLPVSVNLSQLHLYQTSFVNQYLNIIKKYEIPTSLISLELTETALFENEEVLRLVLNQFRENGIQIQMDDFGSGYSSVVMLNKIPIDILKLDKKLIDDVEHSEKNRKLVHSIISLCHELDIQVIAEGVETKEQFELLKDLNADFIQGYYFAKPLPLLEYTKLIFKSE